MDFDCVIAYILLVLLGVTLFNIKYAVVRASIFEEDTKEKLSARIPVPTQPRRREDAQK